MGINGICWRMVKKIGDVIMKTHHPQNVVMIYGKGLMLQSSLRRVQRRIWETAGQLQLISWKKKKCLYISKQRKNKEMVSKRIYLQQTRPVVSNSNCPAMLTCLARKKSFLFGSAFIRSFYIGSVFQGSTQYEGSDLSVLIHKTVKRVPVPLCSQKGAHSLILRV